MLQDESNFAYWWHQRRKKANAGNGTEITYIYELSLLFLSFLFFYIFFAPPPYVQEPLFHTWIE
jgi:hypothetical protein